MFSACVFLLPQNGHTANVGNPISVINTGPLPVGGASPNSLSLRRPSSLIRSVVQGGSNVKSTATSDTPSTAPMAPSTSSLMMGTAGQPVKVGSTVTSARPPSTATDLIMPMSTTETAGISGSGTPSSAFQT